MNTNEPTTGEIIDTECVIRALNTIAMVSPQWSGAIKVAADRLESQERTIAELKYQLKLLSLGIPVQMRELTARAESAEQLAAERGQMSFDAEAKVLPLEAQVADEKALRESAEVKVKVYERKVDKHNESYRTY